MCKSGFSAIRILSFWRWGCHGSKFALAFLSMALVAASGAVVHAEPPRFAPFDAWEKNTTEWKTDPSEIGYVSLRCGAVFMVVGNYFLASSTSDAQKLSGQELLTLAEKLALHGINIGLRSGMSVENLKARSLLFADVYGKQLRDNKIANNNVFLGDLNTDFDFCVSNHSYLSATYDLQLNGIK